MGLPQQQDRPEASQPQTNPPPTTAQPTSASQLPPAAIELASKLFDYAREGKTAELAQYLTAGIPINLTNHKGDTLLMLASYHGHASTVQMLLEKNADPNILNDRGQSPIAGAVFKGHDEVVKALFERSADVRAGQPNAVDSARMFRREEFVVLFGAEGETGELPGMIPPPPTS